jgi:hypothetical protein
MECCALQSQLYDITLIHSCSDIMRWRWSSTGIFSVHSFYERLKFDDIPNADYTAI